MNLPEEGEEFPFTPVDALANAPDDLIDGWITSRFILTTFRVTEALNEMRFADAAKLLYTFVWNDFCDWYLELIKPRLQNGGEEKRKVLAHALGVLHGTLRLLHPFMPFITEEIFQQLRRLSEPHWPATQRTKTILFAPYPATGSGVFNFNIEEEFNLLEETVNALRNIRGELRIAKQVQMTAGILHGTSEHVEFLRHFAPFIQRLASLDRIEFGKPKPRGSASAVVRGMEVFVPLGGLIDLKAERARLAKEQERLTKLEQGAQARLADPRFVENADPLVVQNERDKLANLEHSLEKVNRYIEEINFISED
jgi:valyl-tRNA synthetase